MVLDVKFVKIGNSISVRIPKVALEFLHIANGTQADLIIDDQQLVLRPKSARRRLTELLNAIHPDNLHAETDTGPETGNEKWAN